MRISIGKIFFACLLVACTAYGIRILRGPHAFSEKHRMIEQLEKENETLNREIEDKKAYLIRLQNPEEMGLAIEDRLKLVNPGSKSFMLQEKGKQDGSGAEDAPHPASGTAR